MTEDQVKQIVIDIIAEIAPDEDTSNIKSEVKLRDQLDLDSMDFLDIVMEPVSYTHLTLPTKA